MFFRIRLHFIFILSIYIYLISIIFYILRYFIYQVVSLLTLISVNFKKIHEYLNIQRIHTVDSFLNISHRSQQFPDLNRTPLWLCFIHLTSWHNYYLCMPHVPITCCVPRNRGLSRISHWLPIYIESVCKCSAEQDPLEVNVIIYI